MLGRFRKSGTTSTSGKGRKRGSSLSQPHSEQHSRSQPRSGRKSGTSTGGTGGKRGSSLSKPQPHLEPHSQPQLRSEPHSVIATDTTKYKQVWCINGVQVQSHIPHHSTDTTKYKQVRCINGDDGCSKSWMLN